MVFSKSLEWKMAHSEECEALNLLYAALRTKAIYEAQRNQTRSRMYLYFKCEIVDTAHFFFHLY